MKRINAKPGSAWMTWALQGQQWRLKHMDGDSKAAAREFSLDHNLPDAATNARKHAFLEGVRSV